MTMNKKKRKKISTSALVLIIACIIIAIPVIIFAVIIISAAVGNGKPVFGERFKNDLNPAISESQISSVENSIKSISGVEDCEVVMTTAQFRVNIDTSDSYRDDDIKEIIESAYSKVNSELPVNTYFTMSSDGQRMYDLAISAYNYIPSSNEDANWVCYVLTKNSKMDEYDVQSLSSAKNPDLAKELRGETTPEVDEEAPEGDQTK